MTETIIEPLSCPFCAGQPEIGHHYKETMWRLVHRCPVVGPISVDWSSTREGVIRTWNTRAPAARPPQLARETTQ